MQSFLEICISDSVIQGFLNFLREMLPAYILLLAIRVIALAQMWKCFGVHRHTEEANKITVKFYVRYNWLNLVNPIPRISIRIKRIAVDSENWRGKFYSDFLNPTHFTGPYIKDAKIAETGWHDVIFFIRQRRIAFNLHHLKMVKDENGKDIKQWQNDDGYYIEKI